MKEFFKKLDVYCGKYINLEYSHYVKYDKLLDTEGQYSKEDWEKHREAVNIYSQSSDRDLVFLKKVLFDEFNKAISFNELTHKFDFFKYKEILEIGSGYMYQTFLLDQYCENSNITASDFDSIVISESSNVKLLNNINKIELNILEDNIDKKYDFSISWAVEYHFTTQELELVLNKLSKNKTNYLVMSLTIATPIRKLKNIINTKKIKNQIKDRQTRAHGWERSLNYFEDLANETDFNFKYIGKCGDYHALWFYK
jgi:hypothetical protein